MSQPKSAQSLYQQALLEESMHPVGRDVVVQATHQASGDNPLCGDQIELMLQVVDGSVINVGFSAQACAVCLASASLLCRHLPSQTVDAVIELVSRTAVALQAGDKQPAPCPEGFEPLLSVCAFPARVACAQLPLDTVLMALEGYEGR